MKNVGFGTILFLCFLGLSFGAEKPGLGKNAYSVAAAVGTAFSYQGRLLDGDQPANGGYDLRFTLYDDPATGALVGGPIEQSGCVLTSGLFNTTLDFGAAPFNGQALYLEIAVRRAGGAAYTVLAPRQQLTAVPYALGLRFGATVTGSSEAGLAAVTMENKGVYNGYGLEGASFSQFNGAGVMGVKRNTGGHTGYGVMGWTYEPGFHTAGVAAVYNADGGGTALEVCNGAMKVSGVNRTAFRHTVTPESIPMSGNHITYIDNLLTNGDPDALLLVTHSWHGGIYNVHPYGVYYDSNEGKWSIYNEDVAAVTVGDVFNVLVIKQQ